MNAVSNEPLPPYWTSLRIATGILAVAGLIVGALLLWFGYPP
jgi:hypothetical protein